MKLTELNATQFFNALECITPLFPVLEKIDIRTAVEDKTGIAIMEALLVKLLPTLLMKENRQYIFGLISILEDITVEEVERLPAYKLITILKNVFAEGELVSFLELAKASDTAKA